jgi:hypothetical protein
MSKRINLRIDCLEDISTRKKERADERFRAALLALPQEVKETALDALGAVFRGDPLTSDQQNALDQCEAAGYFQAVEDSMPYETESEQAGITELAQRMNAGEDWREITLSTRRI